MSNGITVKIQNLSKRFGDLQVLNEVNLDIASGEFVAIVGRSGCGKSTLLRLVSGLEHPCEGAVLLDGEPVAGIHSDVRFLFQEARLLPWKRVLDNVQTGSGGNKAAATQALEAVGLASRAKNWPYVLSGGQRQRVSLARALSGSPRLMLFDEPLGALDALTRIEMQQLIERLWWEKWFTVILVTHDVSEAVALADRVILIDEGNITMDMRITLNRPRIRNSDFAYFEKHILDRVMEVHEDEAAFIATNTEYSI